MSHNVNFKDITNQKFGYLTALYIDENRVNTKHTYWICECVCGKKRSLQTHQLTTGKVTSCGCQNLRKKKSNIIAHNHRLYNLYNSMLGRCYNPKCINYKYYGAKGISVCDEWKNSFETFVVWANQNGYNDTLSIDRIDNSKGYNPENCRWVEMREQYINKKYTALYTHNGITLTMKEWCDVLDFSYVLAKTRRREAKRKNIEPSFEYVFAPPKFTRKK